jgi:curved DNA-binding protein CbpA
MTPRQDPYRVLGLVPGATAGEIRSAYRRLAKLNHPDTAGERSLPRFLAIKAAYEELVDGEGRLRSRGWPGRTGEAGASRPSGSPANRASREAWRARRAAGASGAGGSAGGDGADGAKPGAAGARESTSRSGSSSGSGSKAGSRSKASTDPKAGPNPRAGGRARTTERRTARPGSTTYDEATQPLDPSWEGGSWYGASSGRYWTLNPREYADPRKHGPEYQERARRAAQIEAARRAGTSLPLEDAAPEHPDASTEPLHQGPPSSWAPSSASSSPDPLPRYRRTIRRPSTSDGP